MKPLDLRDYAILDAFPFDTPDNTVLNVGCGEGRIDYYLASIGYQIYATDIKESDKWKNAKLISFHRSDIFDLASFPVKSAPVVICSQVLEHLPGYKLALINLLALTEKRLIITVPEKKSFYSPSHVNLWSDGLPDNIGFKNIREFQGFCKPYSVAISKIITKEEDIERAWRNYLIVVDKRQRG